MRFIVIISFLSRNEPTPHVVSSESNRAWVNGRHFVPFVLIAPRIINVRFVECTTANVWEMCSLYILFVTYI